jgi:hypothetical protein
MTTNNVTFDLAKQIAEQLTRQMAEQKLRFDVLNADEEREVIEETTEYIIENYAGTPAEMVEDYIKETLEQYPEHIERIREYIQPS